MSRLLQLLGFIATVISLWGSSTAIAYAVPSPPPWHQQLNCDPADQRYRGVEYCTAEDGQIHVIVVDLYSSGVRLEYIIARGTDRNGQPGDCKDVNRSTKPLKPDDCDRRRPGCNDVGNSEYYPVMALTDAVKLARTKDPNTAAVINSDYGASTQGDPKKSRDHGPEGFAVIRGQRIDGPAQCDYDDPGTNPDTNNAVRRPWLAVSRDTPIRAELNQLQPGQDNGSKPDWVYTGVGGGPWLIWDGEVVEGQIEKCTNVSSESCRPGVSQTAVGLSGDRRWLFLVVDERRGQLIELARFMREKLDAWDAIKFDGGGSSQLWYGGRVITPGDGRQLSQYLAVVAEPGAGIENTLTIPGLSAQPTSPLFFDIILPGETAHLHIEVRNTGQTTWLPGQGIELRRVWKDVVSPVVESYPLPHAVPAGDTVSWEIAVNTGGERFTRLYFQMYQGDTPFGPEIGAVVITLPEELKAQEEKIRRAIEEQLQEWQQQAEREVARRLEEFQKQLLELIQRELERQAKRWIDEVCGGSAMLLGGMLLLVLRQRQR